MAQRGRKSAASKAVATPKGGLRPLAPAELTEFQREEWAAIVGRMPADWFTRETHGLLTQYVRHAENARKLASVVDQIGAEEIGTEEGAEKFDRLSKMAEREGRAMSSLATRMRLTHQSRYTAMNANTASKKAGSGALKPWEE